VQADLAPESGRAVVILAQWEGSTASPVSVQATADTVGLSLRVAPDGKSLSYSTPDGDKTVSLPAPGSSDAGLLLKIENPPDAKTDLLIESVLVLTARQ
jgi:hypothetical protein